MAKTICLHQLQRPLAKIETKGWGNCLICVPNENNKNCEGHWLKTIYELVVLPEVVLPEKEKGEK